MRFGRWAEGEGRPGGLKQQPRRGEIMKHFIRGALAASAIAVPANRNQSIFATPAPAPM